MLFIGEDSLHPCPINYWDRTSVLCYVLTSVFVSAYVRERETLAAKKEKTASGQGHYHMHHILHVTHFIACTVILCNVFKYMSMSTHMLVLPPPTEQQTLANFPLGTCSAIFDPPPTLLYIFNPPHPPL